MEAKSVAAAHAGCRISRHVPPNRKLLLQIPLLLLLLDFLDVIGILVDFKTSRLNVSIRRSEKDMHIIKSQP